MGAGRSGTTLLDTILGNNEDIFSSGELNRFPKYCGQPLLVDEKSPTAVFWNNFKLKFPEEMQADKFRTIHNICHSFEYHSNIYKLWLPLNRKEIHTYQEYLKSFFSILGSMISQNVVVDSSKYPLRGYYLSRLPGYEVVYIYIKRNPIDVVKSFAKKNIEQPSQGWFPANIYMMMVNSISMYVFFILRKKHKMMTVNYNELVENPTKVLQDIADKLNLDLNNSIRLARNGEPFQKGLLFDGNRMRLEKEVRLQKAGGQTKPESLKDYTTLLLQKFWWN